MKVKIIADSTCDLPKEIIHKFDIDIIPLYVILDEQSYKDSLEITTRELVDWSNATNKTPKTSAPSVDDFMNAFSPYVQKKQDIVFVCIFIRAFSHMPERKHCRRHDRRYKYQDSR